MTESSISEFHLFFVQASNQNAVKNIIKSSMAWVCFPVILTTGQVKAGEDPDIVIM